MSLCKLDCTVGTIVDHRWEKKILSTIPRKDKDGKEIQPGIRWKKVRRPTVRRGIIVGVKGEKGVNIESVSVLFNPNSKPEEVLPVELDRFLKAKTRMAKEALRRVRGQASMVGREFTEAKPVRNVVADSLALTPTEQVGKVYDDPSLEGMGFDNPDIPTVVPDNPEPEKK